jgi:hypothetical protein
VKWFGSSPYLHLTTHSNSTSAVVGAAHTSAGPGQQLAKRTQSMVARLPQQYRAAESTRIKCNAEMPGNERADTLAGKAAEKAAWSPTASLAYMKLRCQRSFGRVKKNETRAPATMELKKIHPLRQRSHVWTREKCHYTDGRADQNRPFAFCTIPQQVKGEERR